jgi:hypothetical protein
MPPAKSTAVTKSNELPLQNMAEVATAGQLLAQAGYLGTRNPGEGFLVMASARQMGISLVEFQQKFHFRQGRFSMAAHAILAEFESRGGKFEMVCRTPEKAELRLVKNEKTYNFAITWEECKEEPFIYAGNELEQLAELKKPFDKRKLKNKYMTPRSRMQMLWARLVSDSVATIDPAARLAYTPEETDDIIDTKESGHNRVEKEVDPAQAAKDITPQAQTPKPATAPAETKPEIKDAEVVEEDTKNPLPVPEKSPFKSNVADFVPDYSVCPFGPPETKGVKWADMPQNWLERVMDVTAPELTEGHKKAAREALEAMKEKQA